MSKHAVGFAIVSGIGDDLEVAGFVAGMPFARVHRDGKIWRGEEVCLPAGVRPALAKRGERVAIAFHNDLFWGPFPTADAANAWLAKRGGRWPEFCDGGVTVHRSERERRDEETSHWQLLDEIMEAIRCEYQSPDEVIEALTTAMAKVIVQADLTAAQIEAVKRDLDGAIDFQRNIEGLRR